VIEWTKKQLEQLEVSLENMRNKKQKGTTKKVNEKQRTINLKITQVKALKDKVEEIFTSSVDIIDAASIKNLKILLTQYM
jgi:hypothetical protein